MEIIDKLVNKGVCIPNPDSIEIDEEINPDRISGKGITIHSGCKITGKNTLILDNVTIGSEAPVTIENCQMGTKVQLKGGYFENAVFLEGSSAGSGAHVRQGTIFEEGARVAHTVGLKQTILFPFVTLGSLINFCDCFMAGGTNSKNHSEVGSSYIHFNYTPNQDKATASLIGDVPNGVMLNQHPIFLGGQGGLVGPCRINYGTVIAAGSIYRKDILKPDRLVFEGGGRGGSMPNLPGIYRSVRRQTHNNIIYIANLIALMHWYKHVRALFVSDDFPMALYEALTKNLDDAIKERIKRLKAFCRNLDDSAKKYKATFKDHLSPTLMGQKEVLYHKRRDVEALFLRCLNGANASSAPQTLLTEIAHGIKENGEKYIKVITSLDEKTTSIGSEWLQGIVDDITRQALAILPPLS